jgi:hypothetical protein
MDKLVEELMLARETAYPVIFPKALLSLIHVYQSSIVLSSVTKVFHLMTPIVTISATTMIATPEMIYNIHLEKV